VNGGGASNPLRRTAMMTVLAARELVELGPSTMAAVVANSLRTSARGRRDRRAEISPAVTRAPGPLLRAAPDRYGLRCQFAEAELEVRFLRDDMVRLTWGPGDLPVPWALAHPEEELVPAGPVTVDGAVGPDGELPEGGPLAGAAHTVAAAATAATEALGVEVSTEGDVRFVGPDGALLRHELPPLRHGAARTARHLLRDGERVAGLGEQAAFVDLRGTTHRLWNRDPGGAWGPGQDPLYCGIPVLVGLHPQGDLLTFYENPYEAVVRVDAQGSGRTEVTFAGGLVRQYVATGPLPRLLERYAELTGTSPMPPRWTLGFHQSRWGYKSEADIRRVADGFRDEGVPLSAVHLDIDYMDGYRVFTVDRRRFPDLTGLCADLGTRGTRVVTIVDPAVKADPADSVFQEGLRGGRFLCASSGRPFVGVVWPGRAAFPDFTDPQTRRWWADHERSLIDQGVAGVWHDMNEPTSITMWGDRTLPLGTRHAVEGRGGDHRECHNVYGHLMNEAGWEAQVAAAPERRPWVLSRAGWAGMQRTAWNWTADIESSWRGLRQQIATSIGLGLSGVPYTGSDIGGFSGTPSPELFVRWLELSVLMPFCRTHCVLGSPPREPWAFPEPYRSAIGRLVRFRYRLLPYLYTLAHEAARTGHPLVRPLCWPSGRGPWSDDTYLLGDALLVAPVTEGGARTRSVTLPDGGWYRWRPFPEDVVSPVAGGGTVRLEAPLGEPVVLVREGSVVPLDDGEHGGALTPGHEPALAAVHCFSREDGTAEGTCYDDAGDGHGPWRLDRFRLEGGVLRWEREGDHPAPPALRVAVHGPGSVSPVVAHRPFDRLRLGGRGDGLIVPAAE
jgi:alpha-glucosidase